MPREGRFGALVIAKGELERRELRGYLLEALAAGHPRPLAELHRAVGARLRDEFGAFAPVWRRIEVHGELGRLAARGQARQTPAGWLRGDP